jgi:phosphatidylglycerol:prolipoprotein diacylglycerol transferase
MLAIAFIVPTYLAGRMGARNPETIAISKQLVDFSLWVLISGIIGARIFYVLLNIDSFRNNPWETIMFHHGGLVFYGGLLGAIVGGFCFLKRKKLPLALSVDFISPWIALGHAIGRIGCFLNGCCYGKSTSGLLGVRFPDIPYTIYPTQIFSSLGLLVIFFILQYYYTKSHGSGQVFLAYLCLYSLFRFCIEFFRGDSDPVLRNLSIFQVISIGIFGISTVAFVLKWKNIPLRSERRT